MTENRTPRTVIATLSAACLLFTACGSSTDETAALVAPDTNVDSTASADTTSTSENSQVSDDTGEDTPLSSDHLGSYTLMDDDFGNDVTVTVDGSTRTIESNALPDHETGEFPNSGNPNTISAQDASWEFTTDPTYIGNATPTRTSGVAVNGIKFEPGTGETVTCSSGETYRIEALQDVYDLGLDFNNAHVQPTGEYHYHGISELLVEAYQSDEDLVHVGFAADGFLMYYSKSGAYQSG